MKRRIAKSSEPSRVGRGPSARHGATALMFSLASMALFAAASGAASASDALDPDGFASSGDLDLTSGAYTIDTSGGAGGAPVLLDGSTVLATGSIYHQGGSIDPSIGVLDFSNVAIGYGVTVTVVGNNPLALLSRGSQSISGQILANGQSPGTSVSGGAGGPGGFSGGAGGAVGSVGSPGNGPGGGQSTYGGVYGFGAGGAYGGSSAGGIFNDPAYSGTTYGDLNEALLGGSGGSGAGPAFGIPGGGGGGGGGAIELVAVDGITISDQSFQSDGLVQANGGGGGAYYDPQFGGGGSGGGIIIAAPTLTFQGNSTSVEASGAGWDGGGGRILLLSDAGGLTFGGAPYSQAGLNFYVSTYPQIEGYSSGVVQVETLDGFISPGVPEIPTWAAMLLGFAGLGFVARRRAAWRRRRAPAVG